MKSFLDEKLILNEPCQSRIRKTGLFAFQCWIARLPKIYDKEMGIDESQQ